MPKEARALREMSDGLGLCDEGLFHGLYVLNVDVSVVHHHQPASLAQHLEPPPSWLPIFIVLKSQP